MLDADLDKIIYTEAFDFEHYRHFCWLDTWNRERLTEEQKKKRRSMHTIIIMKVVKWMNMASVLCVLSSSGF